MNTEITKINHENMDEFIHCECKSISTTDRTETTYVKELQLYNSITHSLITIGDFYIHNKNLGYSKSKNSDVSLKKALKNNHNMQYLHLYIKNNCLMSILQTLIGSRAVTNRQHYINSLGKISKFKPYQVSDFNP